MGPERLSLGVEYMVRMGCTYRAVFYANSPKIAGHFKAAGRPTVAVQADGRVYLPLSCGHGRHKYSRRNYVAASVLRGTLLRKI